MIADLLPHIALSRLLTWGVALVGPLALGYMAGSCGGPETKRVTETDTVTVERQITRTDTVTETVPKIVRRYDTIRTTDTIRVPVPSELDMQGVIEPQPLDVQDDQATLTFWDPKAGRYTQNVYDIPQPTWSLAPTITAEANSGGPVLGAALTVTRNRLAVSGGYEVAPTSRGWTFGVTWTPLTIDW